MSKQKTKQMFLVCSELTIDVKIRASDKGIQIMKKQGISKLISELGSLIDYSILVTYL